MSPTAAPENEVKLTLWDHLRELRKRLLLAIYGLVVGFGVVIAFVGQIFDRLMMPVLEALKPPAIPEAARALLHQFAAGPGLGATEKAAVLECADQKLVSEAAKQVLAVLAQGQGLAGDLADVLATCGTIPSLAEPAKKLVYTSAIEPMMLYLQVSFYGAIFVAAPWILYQLWQFIAPGLYKKERRMVVPFLFFGTLLFYGGAAFCYFFVLPPAFPAMLQFASSNTMTPMLSISEQLSLVTAMLLGFGIVFEVPVIIAFLALIGLVTADWLAKYRRHAIVVNVILAAIITPTGDPLNLAMMAVPMVVFYEVGIVLARILGKKKPADEAAAA